MAGKRTSAIDELDAGGDLLTLRRAGKSYDAIAAELSKKHGRSISAFVIGRWARGYDNEQSAIRKSAYTEAATVEAKTRAQAAAHAGQSLPRDLEVLDEARDRLQAIVAATDPKDAIAAARALATLVKTRFDVTGAKPLGEEGKKKKVGDLGATIGESARQHYSPHTTTRTERSGDE